MRSHEERGRGCALRGERVHRSDRLPVLRQAAGVHADSVPIDARDHTQRRGEGGVASHRIMEHAGREGDGAQRHGREAGGDGTEPPARERLLRIRQRGER